MGRVEYWFQEAAPTANTLVPACGALVVDDTGRILMQKRRDTGQWALPMGKMELGETPTECAIRETEEETGIRVEILSLVGIFSEPNHIVAYTDGEIRQEFEITYLARPVRGEPTSNDEASDVRWFSLDALGTLDVHPSMRRQIAAYVDDKMPYLQ
ncbi:NUDIX domain-containing protein [Actinoplanes subtropicus]|uniref:NUDIX domain-containing protein n=1 Tax=Actinoplanes subtropicus TaxID=543632 RepID=UPI0004C418DC|nr:NUDIX domain-containing protein [Actinoplanes subtropicus]